MYIRMVSKHWDAQKTFHRHEIKNIFKDYELGLEYAKKSNMPVMIDFTGQACVNCRKIEEAIWYNGDELQYEIEDDKIILRKFIEP